MKRQSDAILPRRAGRRGGAGTAAPAGPLAARRYKYLALRDSLRDQITGGAFAADDMLPSESVLGTRFGVSRVTVRLALDALRKAGLVESRQGKGYFVRRIRVVQDLGRLQGLGEMMSLLDIDVRSEVVELAEVAASAELQKMLRLERGAPVTRVSRIRMARGAALSYDVSHFPLDIGRRLAPLNLADADIFALLEQQLGIELGYADISLDVAVAEGPISHRLGVRDGDPLVRIVRLTYDHGGRPVDFEHLHLRPDAFQFRIRAPRW